MKVTGKIHSVQSLGAVDGPGLRFVVFMQGCSLRCAYCHNPDTWDFSGGTETSPEELVISPLFWGNGRRYCYRGRAFAAAGICGGTFQAFA